MSTPTGSGGKGNQHVPGQVTLPGMTLPEETTTAPQKRRPRSTTERAVVPKPGEIPIPETGRTGASLPKMSEESLKSQEFRDEAFKLATGRNAPAAGDSRSQLLAAYGPSRRDSTRPDTRAAAQGLGVHQRTVQKWLQQDRVPERRHKDVQRAARQAMTTKRGRRRVLRDIRRQPTPRATPNQGLKIGGRQGVESDIDLNYRDRSTNVGFTNDDLAHLQDVWAEHGSDGVSAFLHQHMDKRFEQSWHMDSIDSIQWGSSKNYRTS